MGLHIETVVFFNSKPLTLIPACLVLGTESYYVNFYVAINIGALVGGITVPLLAEVSMEAAYLVPVCALVLGMMVFLGASRRYVRRPPEKKALFDTLKLIGKAAVCKPFSASKQSQGGTLPDAFVNGISRLLQAVPVAWYVYI